MSFQKFASVQHLGTATAVDNEKGLQRTAQLAEDDPQTSYYLDGSAKVDVRGILERVADKYAISADPGDYIFEAIRANTTDVFNDNGDGFAREELLSFNPRLKTAVYLTYREKPHHVNHRTDNPKRARGVILDAHYNAEATPMEHCPGCNTRTAERNNRDKNGTACKNCGTLVADEFVEILVAVDAKKDPEFARGVERGQLRFGSMGCTCAETVCNVCDNVARSRSEFCTHIRAHKGSYWARKASGDDWFKVSASTAEREMKARGRQFHARDFVKLVAKDGYEIRKAAEWCQGVEYDEYSRVHMPADYKAEQREVLNRAASSDAPSADDLRNETMQLVAAARLNARGRRTAMKFTVVRIDDDETFVGESLAEALELANPDEMANVEYAEVDAEDAGAARLMADQSGFKMLDRQADFNLNVKGKPDVSYDEGELRIKLDRTMEEDDVSMLPEDDALPALEEEPALSDEPSSIEEFTEDEMNSEPGDGDELSPEELGVMPASANKEAATMFDSSYADWKVQVSPRGNAQVVSPAGPVMIMKAAKSNASDNERVAFAKSIMDSLSNEGLLRTAARFDAAYHARFASVVDGAIDDMKEFMDKDTKPAASEHGADDMGMSEMRGKHADDARDHAARDMKMAPEPRIMETSQGRASDHELGNDEARPESSSENQGGDMRGDARSFSMSDSAIDNPAMDHSRAAGMKHSKDHDHDAGMHHGKDHDHDAGMMYGKDHDHEAGMMYGKDHEAGMHYGKDHDHEAGMKHGKDHDHEAGMEDSKEAKDCEMSAELGDEMKHSSGRVARVASINAKAQTYDLVDASLNVERVTAADLMSQWRQLDQAPQAEMDKRIAETEARIKSWAQSEIEKATKRAYAEAFRAVRVAAGRQAKGLSESPLKVAMATELANNKVVGHDAVSRAPLEYQGMADELAIHLVEAAYSEASENEVDTILRSAASLLKHDAGYRKSAEADLQKVAYRVPVVTAAAMVSDLDREAEALRRQASAGNLELSSNAASDADSSSKIRNALNITRAGARVRFRQ